MYQALEGFDGDDRRCCSVAHSPVSVHGRKLAIVIERIPNSDGIRVVFQLHRELPPSMARCGCGWRLLTTTRPHVLYAPKRSGILLPVAVPGCDGGAKPDSRTLP